MTENQYLYELKNSLITNTEKTFLKVIHDKLPSGYIVQPQVNLASIIRRTDNSKYQNELYRNIDACIFNSDFHPVLLIEINDETHNLQQRKSRDYKVKCICEEAGIPIITFWTSYGVNPDYIEKRIHEGIEDAQNPVRICHSGNKIPDEIPDITDDIPKIYDEIPKGYEHSYEKPYSKKYKKNGCYIATCVYGTYNCPELWILRRYRDYKLSSSWYGRLFVSFYYTVSPMLVKLFGKSVWFKSVCGRLIKRKIKKLTEQGYPDTPYEDINQ